MAMRAEDLIEHPGRFCANVTAAALIVGGCASLLGEKYWAKTVENNPFAGDNKLMLPLACRLSKFLSASTIVSGTLLQLVIWFW